jgi:hypothetical protein
MPTERETVLRERAAFLAGRLDIASNGMIAANADVNARAAERYPLPKVTRPRVVEDPTIDGIEWSLVCGSIRIGTSMEIARGYPRSNERIPPTASRVALWADLFAHPTEEVEG